VTGEHSSLEDAFGYVDDFHVGQRIRHVRSSTVTDLEGHHMAKLMMNTAQAHWSDTFLPDGRLVFGLCTASLVMGLASQDTLAHAVREVSVTGLRFRAPVRQGATLTAYTEVTDIRDSSDVSTALVTFLHRGVDQDGQLVFEGSRTAEVRRRDAGARPAAH
jgi:itaconyl-CoA hydratase